MQCIGNVPEEVRVVLNYWIRPLVFGLQELKMML
jgi:hypothetical protein